MLPSLFQSPTGPTTQFRTQETKPKQFRSSFDTSKMFAEDTEVGRVLSQEIGTIGRGGFTGILQTGEKLKEAKAKDMEVDYSFDTLPSIFNQYGGASRRGVASRGALMKPRKK